MLKNYKKNDDDQDAKKSDGGGYGPIWHHGFERRGGGGGSCFLPRISRKKTGVACRIRTMNVYAGRDSMHRLIKNSQKARKSERSRELSAAGNFCVVVVVVSFPMCFTWCPMLVPLGLDG